MVSNGILARRFVAFIILGAPGCTDEVGHGLTTFVELGYSIGAVWMSVESDETSAIIDNIGHDARL